MTRLDRIERVATEYYTGRCNLKRLKHELGWMTKKEADYFEICCMEQFEHRRHQKRRIRHAVEKF